jgi:phosphoglycolate phosphatase-like HAD superfamily hydrolase
MEQVMKYIRLTDQQLKEDPGQQLRNFVGTKDFLIAIDTDGCITDNMNGKQMLIFHPQFMEFYQLWAIESYYREVAEYYNLFSVNRGCNRFIAIQLILKALKSRREVSQILAKAKIKLPDVKILDSFIDYASANKLGLGNPSLERFINENPTELSLYKLLGWSEAVNRMFPHISTKIPPFDNVKNCLDLIVEHADVMVVSQTPYIDLANYWEEYGLTDYVNVIAGHDMGSKAYHIEVAKNVGEYKDDHVLMIGDSNGDLRAAKDNKSLFYPITPGREQEAWNRLPEFFDLFITKRYKGDTEAKLLDDFNKALPSMPPWEKENYDHIKSYSEKQNIRKALYNKFNPTGRLLLV